MLKISDGRKHFWQWDLNQKLLVEYENVCHVHFEDPDGDVALTVETYDLDGKKVADVPNILLQKPQTIHAYVYKCEGDECTIKHTYFNVYERQRPADYVYTETEVKRWETLEERIAALEQGGSDGFSPTVDIEPIDGGHRISITDKDGTQTADVLDGRDGADGYTPVKNVDYFDGQDGRDGDPGADGISPTVAVQDITGGHRVTITDKDGEKTFDVMDGKDGAGGSGGASVQSDWSVNDENDPAYVKNRTHWVERPYEPIVWDGSTEGRDSVDVSLALGYPAGSVFAYKISDHVLTPDSLKTSTAYTTINGRTEKKTGSRATLSSRALFGRAPMVRSGRMGMSMKTLRLA